MSLYGEQAQVVRRVGIADGAVVSRPDKLRTAGLGSCVGLVVYDWKSGLSGMVHVMLPVAPIHVINGSKVDGQKPQKYADLGVSWLIEQLQSEGAQTGNLRAKMAGGAQMFASAGRSDVLRVGPRNVEAVENALASYSIPLLAKDVGGREGRTIEFDTETQLLSIRTAKSGTFTL
ncbi:chemotaxis protein CheD [Alicyclobacillus curvatus]|nr:chemotaxis protein CheD [Alicyclobacillus curvatus]